ncbi:hypothetical protein BH24ACT3_BH24ACT3_02400 [soil metagenome]
MPERQHNPFINSSAGGRALNALQRPFFAIRPPKGYGILITTGRRTGKKRSRCVRVASDGNKAVLVAIKGSRTAWARNALANPVRLRLPGGAQAGTARAPSGQAEKEVARELYCGSVTWFDYLTYANWRTGRPTRAGIIRLLNHWFDDGTPLVVDLCRQGDSQRPDG